MRKTAVNIIPQITEVCSFEDKKDVIVNIYHKFMEDNHKYVRQAAVEAIGQFINLLPAELLDKRILKFYMKTIEDFY